MLKKRNRTRQWGYVSKWRQRPQNVYTLPCRPHRLTLEYHNNGARAFLF